MPDMVEIAGSDRREPDGARLIGPAPSDERITVSILVKQRPEGLQRYREYAAMPPSQRPQLDPDEINAVYGADPNEISKVEEFASEHGLDVDPPGPPPDRTVQVSGTVGQLSALFDTPLNLYDYRGKTFRGRTGRVKVPAEVSDSVEAVFGLDNRPIGRRRVTTAPGTSTTNLLGALDVAQAYNLPTNLDGTGQTIAILEFGGGYRTTDLDKFFGEISLATPTVVSVPVDGVQNTPLDASAIPPNQPSTPGLPVVTGLQPSSWGSTTATTQVQITGSGFTGATQVLFGSTPGTGLTVVSDTQITVTTPVVATPLAVHVTVVNSVGSSNLNPADVFLFNDADGEVALDIEVAGAVAPKANIVVYFAANNSVGWQKAIGAIIADTTNAPKIVSISWGDPEDGTFFTPSIRSSMEALFVQASQMKPPIVLLAASGDNGSSDGATDGNAHVDYPASSPNVTGCGGSVLSLTGTTWSSEVVWDTPSVGTTGGGVSTSFAPPSWQSTANVPTLSGGQTGRGVPDVCGHADSYKIVLRGADDSEAGTSAVAPLWAGILACLNEKVSGGLSADRFYPSAVAAGFHDITSGTNGAYNAGTGWDPCTGLGSPDVSKLLSLLTAAAAPTVTGLSPSSGSSAGGDTVTVTGTGFTGATAVNFGSDAASGLTVVSDTQLTVTSPAASASGAVDVTVTTPAGTSATSSADQFTWS